MIAVVSPAKTLDFEKPFNGEPTKPRLLKATNELVSVLREKTPDDLKDMMGISDSLAELNADRFRNFKKTPSAHNSKPGLYAFQGDVYQGLEADTFNETDLSFAQDHFRILSGLYGLLRPMDLIQPYRLEMGTKLAFDNYRSLYQYWDDAILKLLLRDLKAQGDKTIINLASNEYFKSINRKGVKARIVDVEFKDFNNGEYKIVSFYAKKARGLMSRFMIQNKINDVEELKSFNYEDYYFDEKASSENFLAFKRG